MYPQKIYNYPVMQQDRRLNTITQRQHQLKTLVAGAGAFTTHLIFCESSERYMQRWHGTQGNRLSYHSLEKAPSTGESPSERWVGTLGELTSGGRTLHLLGALTPRAEPGLLPELGVRGWRGESRAAEASSMLSSENHTEGSKKEAPAGRARGV
eukprot:RCo052822